MNLIFIPATVSRAVRLLMVPRLSMVATHWYTPSSGLLCLEWTTVLMSKEPSASCRFLSSATRFRNVPSFFHSTLTGASLTAEQFRTAGRPRTASVSTGSTENLNGVKPWMPEPEDRKKNLLQDLLTMNEMLFGFSNKNLGLQSTSIACNNKPACILKLCSQDYSSFVG